MIGSKLSRIRDLYGKWLDHGYQGDYGHWFAYMCKRYEKAVQLPFNRCFINLMEWIERTTKEECA